MLTADCNRDGIADLLITGIGVLLFNGATIFDGSPAPEVRRKPWFNRPSPITESRLQICNMPLGC